MAKPQDFKNTVFYVDNTKESQAVQRAMFTLGFMWNGKEPGAKREVKGWPTRGFIYVDKDCRMFHGSEGHHTVNGQRCAPAFQEALFRAAEEFKAEKKLKRKESRKRKALIAIDPAFTFGSPVRGKRTEVEFVLRNGERDTMHNEDLSWGVLPGFYDREIVAYRVVKQEPGTVTLQQMVKDIVVSAGGVEVQHVDADGFTIWDGTGFDFSTGTGSFSGPVPMDTKVDVKFRNGEVAYGKSAGRIQGPGGYAAGAFWGNDGMAWDIVAYRVSPTIVHETEDEPPTVYEPLPELGACQVLEPIPADPALDPAANPKHAVGNTSLPMTGVSPLLRAMIALAKHNGALKYGLTNYIGTPVVMSTYLHAIQRHFDAILMGEEVDPVDGVPHWGAIGANLDIIVSARAAGTLIDDRQRQDGQLEAYRALTPLVSSLNDLHKDRNPKHYYMKDA